MKKKNKEKQYVYEISYASGILRSNRQRENQLILSNKMLEDGQFIVVEHIDCGIFIGRVEGTTLGELQNILKSSHPIIDENCEYRYIQDIDVSKWWDKIQRKERMEALRQEMEDKFDEIDKKKKFEYYAQIDDEFRELYSEYSQLEDEV